MIKDTDMLFFILFSLFATRKVLVPSWDACRSLFGGHFEFLSLHVTTKYNITINMAANMAAFSHISETEVISIFVVEY